MKSNKNLTEKTEVHQTTEPKTPVKKTIKFKGLNDKQKSLLQSASAGVGGVALGAVVMSFMGWTTKKAEAKTEEVEIIPSNITNRKGENDLEVPVFDDAPFSDAVNDEMSFSEAFGAARKDIGPGGFFEWRGETYNTYYGEEWNALPADEQQAFYASIDPNHSTEDIVSEEEILDILNDEDDIIDIGDLADEDIVIVDEPNDIEEDIFGDEEVVIIEDTEDDEDPFSADDIFAVDEDIDISDLG